MTSTHGFILDCFAGTRAGRSVRYAIGRLETGETFGLMDDRHTPTLYLRASDQGLARGASVAPSPLRTMDGESVVAVRLADVAQLRRLEGTLRRSGVRTYEGDVDFSLGLLMENDVRGSVAIDGAWRAGSQVGRVYLNPTVGPSAWEPALRILSLDIETDVRTDRVLAVSLVVYGHGPASEEVLVLGLPRAEDPPWLTACPDEPALLLAFAARVKALDPDVVTGWNIADFDLPVLAKRFGHHGVPWDLGRTKEATEIHPNRVPALPGRQVLDALRLVRASSGRFEDHRLGTVAQQLLGRGKTLEAEDHEDKPAKILETYLGDRVAFARYCLEDSRLVRDILSKEKLIELTVNRTRLIGLPLAKTWGSVAAFDFIYRTELRRRGRVAPSYGVDRPPMSDVAGGLVLASRAGLHKHILVFDFRSLYPSIIRTFNIDPLAHALALAHPDGRELTAPNGAPFNRSRGILPEMLDRFFVSRAQAQQVGDKVSSYAYKIIMNSFYGVLGADGCRFASPALAGAITGFGHALLRWTRDHFAALGLAVLYGDTDSLFVDAMLPDEITPEAALARGAGLAAAANAALAAHLEAAYGVASRLELEFEKYYRWFLLPQARGGGSRAKNYAGLKQEGGGEAVEIVGMEAARSDWTPMARGLQRELLGLLFAGAPAATLASRVRDAVAAVAAGTCDAALVYRKQIRKPLTSYTSTTPPHIKAARLLPRAPRVVRYLITEAGPQPLGFVSARVDYAHYVEKQITPIAEMLAELVGFDAAAACRLPGQGGLFGD